MFKATENQNKDESDTDKKRKKIIKRLEKRYYYNEKIEEGRVVLYREDLGLKFVQVIDTEDDRKKYKQVMDSYLQYAKSHYDSNLSLKYDFDNCFQVEILDNKDKRLPMFFAYRDGILVGTVGYRFFFEITDDNGKKQSYNEESIRFTLIKKNPSTIIGRSGVFAIFIIYLYGLKKGSNIMMLTYKCLRDFMFRVFKVVEQKYIGNIIVQECISEKAIDCDVSVNGENISEQQEKKIISFYISTFNGIGQ